MANNPWGLVNRKLGDDTGEGDNVTSRAFTPAAWGALRANLAAAPATGSTARLTWLCTFVEATGLRVAELLGVKRQHLQRTADG